MCRHTTVFTVYSVTRTPNLLHRLTKMEIGVSIEQIWCASHTSLSSCCEPELIERSVTRLYGGNSLGSH